MPNFFLAGSAEPDGPGFIFRIKPAFLVCRLYEPLWRSVSAGPCATYWTVYTDPHKFPEQGMSRNTHWAEMNSMFASRL